MACLQSIYSDTEFDLSLRWLCCSPELRISDSALMEDDSGLDFEFATPALSQWNDALNGFMKAAEDLIQDGTIRTLSQKTPKNRAFIQETEVGSKGKKISEYLKFHQTLEDKYLHGRAVDPSHKKNKSWKEILGFKKPKLFRSNSASRAETPTSECAARMGSDSKFNAGYSKKYDSGTKKPGRSTQSPVSNSNGEMGEKGIPAKIRSSQYYRQSSVSTTRLIPVDLEGKNWRTKSGTKQRIWERPNAYQQSALRIPVLLSFG